MRYSFDYLLTESEIKETNSFLPAREFSGLSTGIGDSSKSSEIGEKNYHLQYGESHSRDRLRD